MKINRKACFRKKSFVNFGADFFNKFFIPPTTSISPIDYSANFDEFMAQRDPEKPFCFWYGAREPHRAYEYGSSSRYGKKLTDIDSVPTYFSDNEIVRTDMLDYAVEIEYFDAHLGKILARLDSLGELENTIVIVTSDHGMPFPRVKGQMNRTAGLPGIRRPDI